MTFTQEARQTHRRRTISRGTGIAMAAEAATFVIASLVHFATAFSDAAVPELLIAVVLGWGSWAVLSTTRRPHVWGTAFGTTAFATLGTILGIVAIATGRQDAPDLAYHAAILTALIVTLAILIRPARYRPLI